MKLKKREITLNEADSLQDMYYMEKALARGYEEGIALALKRETVNEWESAHKRACEDMQLLQGLWEKSKSEQL